MNPWIDHDGGRCPVAADQLVQCIYPGGHTAESPTIMRADQLRWEWRDRDGKPHFGNILRYRCRSQMELTICVMDGDENASVRTTASPMAESDIRPLIDRALAALQAERDALENCAYHRRPA